MTFFDIQASFQFAFGEMIRILFSSRKIPTPSSTDSFCQKKRSIYRSNQAVCVLTHQDAISVGKYPNEKSIAVAFRICDAYLDDCEDPVQDQRATGAVELFVLSTEEVGKWYIPLPCDCLFYYQSIISSFLSLHDGVSPLAFVYTLAKRQLNAEIVMQTRMPTALPNT